MHRSLRATTLGGLLALGTLGAGLAGCSNQRALPMVHAAGNEAYQRGNYEQAIVEYKEYIDRKPYDAHVRHNLAKAYLAAGDAQMAREHATVCHDIDPANTEYSATLAEAMLKTNDLDGLFAFLRSEAAQRGRPADFILLGRYLARVGTADEAEDAFLAAARVDRGQTVEPQWELANFYRAIGAADKETERLRMILWLRPEDPEATARLRELGKVPGPSYALPPAERV